MTDKVDGSRKETDRPRQTANTALASQVAFLLFDTFFSWGHVIFAVVWCLRPTLFLHPPLSSTRWRLFSSPPQPTTTDSASRVDRQSLSPLIAEADAVVGPSESLLSFRLRSEAQSPSRQHPNPSSLPSLRRRPRLFSSLLHAPTLSRDIGLSSSRPSCHCHRLVLSRHHRRSVAVALILFPSPNHFGHRSTARHISCPLKRVHVARAAPCLVTWQAG